MVDSMKKELTALPYGWKSTHLFTYGLFNDAIPHIIQSQIMRW